MTTRRTTTWLIAAAAALVPAALVGPAAAAPPPIQGLAWPGGVVPYHDATPPALRPLIREAVRQWNTSGLRVRFVAVPRARAGVIVRGRVSPAGASGLATLGRDPRPGAGFVFVSASPRDPGVSLGVIIHEFGHTLGLGHTSGRRGCSIMWPVLRVDDCPRSSDPDKELCSLVLPGDVRVLARRYGMRSGARRTPPRFCLRGVAPARPTVPAGLRGMSAAEADAFTGGTRIVLSWTRWRPAKDQRETVRVYPATCAERAGTEPSDLLVRRSGARLVGEDFSGARDATVCVEIEARTQNEFGIDGERFGRGPAIARADVVLPASPPPPPPPPPEEFPPVDPFPPDPFPPEPPPADPVPVEPTPEAPPLV